MRITVIAIVLVVLGAIVVTAVYWPQLQDRRQATTAPAGGPPTAPARTRPATGPAPARITEPATGPAPARTEPPAQPAVRLARSWPEQGPEMLWRVTLGAGFAGPTVYRGHVYILDRQKDAQDILRCLDLADGEELWQFAYDAPGKLSHNGSRAAPAVEDDYVFTVGAFGDFYCFDRNTHKPLWNKHLLNDFDGKIPTWGVAQTPALYRQTVIVSPLGKKAGLAAFDKATGELVWQSPPLGLMAYSSPLLTTLDGVDQVLIANTRLVAGVDAASGKLLWRYTGWKCQIHIPRPTPIGDGRFFITGGYGAGSAMFRVSRQGEGFAAEELFKVPQHGSQIHDAVLHADHLYMGANTNSKHDGLMCLDLDGKVKWQTGRDPNFERGHYFLADGVMLIMDGRAGVLRIVQPDPAGYKELAQAKVLSGRAIWAPMVLSGGKLVLRDQRQMKCLDVGATKPAGPG